MNKTSFLEYIMYDVFGEQEPITSRPMMGTFMLYYEGRPFAIIDNDELYFKGSKELMVWYFVRGGKQFTYKKAETIAYLYYFSVPPAIYEHKQSLEEWLVVALSVATTPRKR